MDTILIKKLDYFEEKFDKSDIDEIKERVALINENVLSIQRLSLKYPGRWPKIYNTLSIIKEKNKIDWEKREADMGYHDIKEDEKESLKKALRLTSLRLSRLKVPLPSQIYNSIYRFIENKDFVHLLDEKSLAYLIKLTETEAPPPNWDKKLYVFLRKYLRRELLK